MLGVTVASLRLAASVGMLLASDEGMENRCRSWMSMAPDIFAAPLLK